jgi:hypothetical protein
MRHAKAIRWPPTAFPFLAKLALGSCDIQRDTIAPAPRPRASATLALRPPTRVRGNQHPSLAEADTITPQPAAAAIVDDREYYIDLPPASVTPFVRRGGASAAFVVTTGGRSPTAPSPTRSSGNFPHGRPLLPSRSPRPHRHLSRSPALAPARADQQPLCRQAVRQTSDALVAAENHFTGNACALACRCPRILLSPRHPPLPTGASSSPPLRRSVSTRAPTFCDQA